MNDKIKGYAERMETIMREINEQKNALKDLKKEIKNDGFDVKALNLVVNINIASKQLEAGKHINSVALYANHLGVQLGLALPEPESRKSGGGVS